jgi:ferric-dicitrate binding protein FerR (iron transport regulator)
MRKKKYTTIHDFLSDKSFTNWVKDNRLADVSFWEFWITNNPEKKEMVHKAKDIVLGIQFKQIQPTKEKIALEWSILKAAIKEKTLGKPKKVSVRYFKHIGVAASVILLLSIGFYTVTSNPSKTVYKTAFGEILTLKLMDGSSVTLNSNTTLHYYNNDNRKVWLTGEAFFEVNKKEGTNATFRVLTNDLTIEVYGTRFNVDTKRQKTAVYLEEGSVLLKLNNGKTQKMTPGNFISYSSKENLIVKQNDNIKSALKTSWKEGAIIFEKLPLIEAIKKIEDTYGVTAIFKDEISKTKLITGGVPMANLEICLQAIEKSVNVKITKLNNQLLIQNK